MPSKHERALGKHVLVIKALAAPSTQLTEFVVTISIERVRASPGMKGWRIL
jgi:hypothetical protein